LIEAERLVLDLIVLEITIPELIGIEAARQLLKKLIGNAAGFIFIRRFILREQRAAARILIADNHRLLADACKSMLEPDFAVVGIVTDGRDLIDAARALKPDIIILNTSMPRLNGLDAGEQIKRKLPATKLVFLTASLKADIVAEVFRRGASACVPMQAAGEELVIAIRKANRGESYLSPLIATDNQAGHLVPSFL
jgi:CheY-like chemotaxis protein